jgi:hypothetical protein
MCSVFSNDKLRIEIAEIQKKILPLLIADIQYSAREPCQKNAKISSCVN